MNPTFIPSSLLIGSSPSTFWAHSEQLGCSSRWNSICRVARVPARKSLLSLRPPPTPSSEEASRSCPFPGKSWRRSLQQDPSLTPSCPPTSCRHPPPPTARGTRAGQQRPWRQASSPHTLVHEHARSRPREHAPRCYSAAPAARPPGSRPWGKLPADWIPQEDGKPQGVPASPMTERQGSNAKCADTHKPLCSSHTQHTCTKGKLRPRGRTGARRREAGPKGTLATTEEPMANNWSLAQRVSLSLRRPILDGRLSGTTCGRLGCTDQ